MTDQQQGSQSSGRSDAEQRRRFEQARDHVAAIKGFYIHLFIYVAVNLGLLVINLFNREVWWVQWPVLAWGLGVLGHAYAVYGSGITFMQSWERRKMKEFMDKG